MLLSMIPALIAVVLFVATLALRPHSGRATMLPPQPAARKS
jgi:hypothetical protein